MIYTFTKLERSFIIKKIWLLFTSAFIYCSAQAQTKIDINDDLLNEIMDSSANVAIIAMTKNGGQGGDANLADLGVTSDEIKGIILSENSIRSTKEGIITIELNPQKAEQIMPALKNAIKRGVVSGCTDNSNICVIDIADCEVVLKKDPPNKYRNASETVKAAAKIAIVAKMMNKK